MALFQAFPTVTILMLGSFGEDIEIFMISTELGTHCSHSHTIWMLTASFNPKDEPDIFP